MKLKKICLKCGQEHSRAHQAKYCGECVKKVRMQSRANWNKRNPQVGVKATKKWMGSNPERRAFWRRLHKGYLKQACPKWASKETLKQIYAECPNGMEVDHIIPLRGKLVSGLHVPNNLQYLTKEENKRKNNICEYI